MKTERLIAIANLSGKVHLDAATPTAKAKLMAANAILAGDKIIGW